MRLFYILLLLSVALAAFPFATYVYLLWGLAAYTGIAAAIIGLGKLKIVYSIQYLVL